MENLNVNLQSGNLDISVTSSDIPLNELCGFASRNNPKRGYLFISKVLGKHYPASPSTMRYIYTLLGEKLHKLTLPYPFLFIAMAETATALGQGVFENFISQTNNENHVFIQTTRYRLKQRLALNFQEHHSHAIDHLLYEPYLPIEKEIFYNAKTLVIVDDEASTGKTLMNLVHAYYKVNPSLKQIVFITITNWLSSEKKNAIIEAMPCPLFFVNILEGSFTFTPLPDFVPSVVNPSVGDYEYNDKIILNHFGRLGYKRLPLLNAHSLFKCLNIYKNQRILVLGTGEFMFAPFKLAEWIENEGYNVKFQATTRSPILLGNDIHSCMAFEDNYFEGIKNYLYNVSINDYDQIIICYETKILPEAHDLISQLNAKAIFFDNEILSFS
ncbi:MAG: phosphoribosyltransferase domain-containing protein [Desulfobacterales bacterium]|nr:phosphoribosyltransferase domain-containing protein [Desulfobacterales bacterium]